MSNSVDIQFRIYIKGEMINEEKEVVLDNYKKQSNILNIKSLTVNIGVGTWSNATIEFGYTAKGVEVLNYIFSQIEDKTVIIDIIKDNRLIYKGVITGYSHNVSTTATSISVSVNSLLYELNNLLVKTPGLHGVVPFPFFVYSPSYTEANPYNAKFPVRLLSDIKARLNTTNSPYELILKLFQAHHSILSKIVIEKTLKNEDVNKMYREQVLKHYISDGYYEATEFVFDYMYYNNDLLRISTQKFDYENYREIMASYCVTVYSQLLDKTMWDLYITLLQAFLLTFTDLGYCGYIIPDLPLHKPSLKKYNIISPNEIITFTTNDMPFRRVNKVCTYIHIPNNTHYIADGTGVLVTATDKSNPTYPRIFFAQPPGFLQYYILEELRISHKDIMEKSAVYSKKPKSLKQTKRQELEKEQELLQAYGNNVLYDVKFKNRIGELITIYNPNLLPGLDIELQLPFYEQKLHGKIFNVIHNITPSSLNTVVRVSHLRLPSEVNYDDFSYIPYENFDYDLFEKELQEYIEERSRIEC